MGQGPRSEPRLAIPGLCACADGIYAGKLGSVKSSVTQMLETCNNLPKDLGQLLRV